jgi:hypothetical protein
MTTARPGLRRRECQVGGCEELGGGQFGVKRVGCDEFGVGADGLYHCGVHDDDASAMSRWARTTNLELSPAYESSADTLLDETGMTRRAERRIHDIAADPDAVEPADVVVLHRVVCCYPDDRRLLTAAADHARRLLVFSYPPDNPVSKALLRVPNLVFAARRMRYRAFVHPTDHMLGILAEHGLRAVYGHNGVAWQVAGFAR